MSDIDPRIVENDRLFKEHMLSEIRDLRREQGAIRRDQTKILVATTELRTKSRLAGTFFGAIGGAIISIVAKIFLER